MMDPNYSKPIIVSNSAEPGTPDVGMSYLYVDSSGVVSTKGSNGQVIKSIGGSTGATDNAILRADGTGGATLQNSGMTIDDTNLFIWHLKNLYPGVWWNKFRWQSRP